MFSCCCCWFFFSYSFRSCCWSNYRHFGIEKQKERNCATRHSFAKKKKQNKRKNWGKQHWEDSKRVNLSPCALWRLHTWSRGQTRMLCSKLTHNYTYPQSAWAKKKQTKTNHDNVDRFLWCVKRRRLTKATTSESSQLFFRIPAAQHRLYRVPSATRGTRAVQWIHALLGTQVGAWCIHNMNMSIEFIGYQTDISVMFVCVICFCFCISSHIYKPA